MERNYGDGETMVQYLQRVDEYVRALEELNYKVDEKEIIYTALQGLDQEANEALLQYLHLEQQKWTKAWIWEVLVSDEARKRDAGRGVEGGMGAGDRAASKKYQQRQGGGGKKKELDKCLDSGEEVQEQQEEQKAAAPHHEESPTAGSTPDPNAPAHDPEQPQGQQQQQEKPQQPPQQHTPPVLVGRWQQLLQQQLSKSPRSPMKRVTWREKLQSLEQGEASPLRRTTRISWPPERFTPSAQYACMHDHEVHDLEECMLVDADGGAHGLDFCLMGQVHEPKSVKEALSRPEWVESMREELESHKVNESFELVDPACVPPVPPSWANIVDGMWIFRVKQPLGSPPAFKARYVARGFSQRQGGDYFHTFFPTPKMTTLRVLLHVAAHYDYELQSLDFSTTFLQGSLHEEIWLRSPPGFTGSFPAGTQWSLRRPVYGVRQAPCEWHDTLRTTLAALGFAPSTDPSPFLRTDTSLPPFYVLVYVDDLVFATADTKALTLVNSELQKRHTCTDLGELRSYLGLQVTRDRARHTITLTQSHMVHQVLQRFSFQFSSPQPTPLSTGHSLSAPPSDESVEPSGPYPELVGCLMYLMTCTRPCLAYLFSLLARYVAPGRHRKVHWDAAKRVLHYLCSTSGMGLVLGGRGPVVLTGHADAS
ncbi:unnamed protein product [Closterium sp. NIES-54]